MQWLGERILTAMPAQQGCATMTELVAATGLTRPQISKAIANMAERGLCVRARKGAGPGGSRVSCYRRTPAGDTALATKANLKTGPNKPPPPGKRDQGLRGRVWTALRRLQKATVVELIELAGRAGGDIEIRRARRYLRHLVAQGIVTKLPRRVPGLHARSQGHVQWLLVKDLGATAPMGPS